MPKPSIKTRRTQTAKEPKPDLYGRGPFVLVLRSGRKNYDIKWYDPNLGDNAFKSTGTDDLAAAERELDRHFLLVTGGPCICRECGQPINASAMQSTVALIADYLAAANRTTAVRNRIEHVSRYIETVLGGRIVPVSSIDENWIEGFRSWMLKDPFVIGKRAPRIATRKPATVEHTIVQFAAAIRWAKLTPGFQPGNHIKLGGKGPQYRLDVGKLAAMFNYCIRPPRGNMTDKQYQAAIDRRASLLAYLRLGVATWGRPDALLDASTAPERQQWVSDARVFDLNPYGRTQTKKYRALVPVGPLVAEWLDSLEPGPVLPTSLVRKTWDRAAEAVGMPVGTGLAGWKLVRRSMATIARKRIGEANWKQGQFYLGHERPTGNMSDLYGLFDVANLGLALKATESIINEIEALAPGAFNIHADLTGSNVVPMRAQA